MNITALRRLHESRPFRPFTIRLADHQRFRVPHNEYLSIAPNGRLAILYDDDGGFTMIDTMLIATVDVKVPKNGKAKTAKA